MATKTNDAKFAVVTTIYDGNDHRRFDAQAKKLMHYKAAAAYAIKIIEDSSNVKFNHRGEAQWYGDIELLELLDGRCNSVVQFSWHSGVTYNPAIDWATPEYYAAVMYLITALSEARNKMLVEYGREMTPAEVEKEFGLTRGVVRKYIFDNRDNLESYFKVIRRADERTWLCKRGWAINRWGDNVRRD